MGASATAAPATAVVPPLLLRGLPRSPPVPDAGVRVDGESGSSTVAPDAGRGDNDAAAVEPDAIAPILRATAAATSCSLILRL